MVHEEKCKKKCENGGKQKKMEENWRTTVEKLQGKQRNNGRKMRKKMEENEGKTEKKNGRKMRKKQKKNEIKT